MARLARIVAAGLPHHVTQRGNRRQQTFFDDGDYAFYKELLAEFAKLHGVKVWAWCLMPNHVHLILVPKTAEALAACVGEVHRRYTSHINLRNDWRGYLWQGRFASAVLDEDHLIAAARYVERNPVRAGLCKTPEDWPWSSARAHLTNKADGLIDRRPLLRLIRDWPALLEGDNDIEDDFRDEALRASERTGRPLGDTAFIDQLEQQLGRTLHRQKPGPKPKLKP